MPPSNNKIRIDASQTTGPNQEALLTFESTDDSPVEMRLGLTSDLSSSAWSPLIATTSIILPNDPESVFVQYKDIYHNTSPVISATHPTAPVNEMIRDITNQSAEIFQLFLAWKKYTDPDFAKYVIYRSDNGTNFTEYATVASSSVNYFFDTTFEFDSGVVKKTYYYRVAIENINGDRSHYTKILSDIPDGQGVDMNPPIISNVASIATSTQRAIITWDTSKESNSTVGFSETPDNFNNIVGVSTMRDVAGILGQHRIVINGLKASTTYYYQVRSTDPQGYTVMQATSSSDVPYSFTTQPGPVISNVSTSSVNKTSATVTWDTSLPADAMVTYSASTSFANAMQITNFSILELFHSITIENLSNNTKYYYYVTSKDADGYQNVGKNIVNDAEVNYEFTTLADAALPFSTSTTCGKSGDNGLMINWLSEKPAISRLLYGTSPGNYSSSTIFSSTYDTAQTAFLANLTASTSYYFILINADLNNNFSTSSTEYVCSTGEKLITEKEANSQIESAFAAGKVAGYVPPAPVVNNGGGGGVLIVDKNDKIAPIITDARVMDVSTSTAKIIWQTNENSSSFVEFGPTANYDSNWGRPELTKTHIAEIRGIQPDTIYHYRISSADASGNLAQIEDRVIKTISVKAELLGHNPANASSTAQATTTMRDFIEKIISSASLDGFDGSLISQYNMLEKLAQVLPTPIFTANPISVTTMDSATVTWQTDKETNSLIAVATEDVFNLNKSQKTPYYRLEGEPYEFVKNHKITLSDLKPGTTYHFQARSRAQLGLVATSKDYTFKTKDEGLSITNFNSEVKNGDQVIFKWLTSQETDAQLKMTPYRNNSLSVDESRIVEERKRSKGHELTMTGLQPGTVYQVELSGIDYTGKKVSKNISSFTTAKDSKPPVISQVQTESALSQGKDRTVQTIISWMTDEPTICEFSFEKGVSDKVDLAEKAPIEAVYSKKHVLVLTKFEPGQVYSFRINASDSSNNVTQSETHTILTPKQREGVFELILRNFESTFGWLKDVGR